MVLWLTHLDLRRNKVIHIKAISAERRFFFDRVLALRQNLSARLALQSRAAFFLQSGLAFPVACTDQGYKC